MSEHEELQEWVQTHLGFHLAPERLRQTAAALRPYLPAAAPSWAPLLGRMAANPQGEAFQQLTRLLCNSETFFYREPLYFDLLIDELLPELQAASSQRLLRVWSAGCATGPEPYTLAVLWHERHGAQGLARLELLGTDCHLGNLERARTARYSQKAVRPLPPRLRQAYFDQTDREFQLREDLRQSVRYAFCLLTAPIWAPPTGPFDCILFRNVSIYFSPRTIQLIQRRLVDLLRPGGYFIVAASEIAAHDLGALALIQRGDAYLFQKPAESAPRPPRPEHVPRPAAAPAGAPGLPLPESLVPDQAPTEGCRCFREAWHPDLVARRETLAQVDPAGLGDRPAADRRAALPILFSREEDAVLRQVCEAVLEEDPLNPEAYFCLGVLARRTGKPDAAIAHFRRAIYADPTFCLAHYFLAETFQEIHREVEGRKAFQQAYDRLLPCPQASTCPLIKIYFAGFSADYLLQLCRLRLHRT